ncbi:MAG: DNA/RNA non-specific endonuclease [Bryobacterales bacterium]|nr:DNA/RNA non-specific endonuclease [Bryobacterales bacterium]
MKLREADSPEGRLRLMRAIVDAIAVADPSLGEELAATRRDLAGVNPVAMLRHAAALPESFSGAPAHMPPWVPETIVLRTGRPVLQVHHDEARLDFDDAASEVWKARLRRAKPLLAPAIRAVGRIELEHHPVFQWVGTGWLVAEGVVATNRHVAQEFGRLSGEKFVFKSSFGEPLSAWIDFLGEYGRAESRDFPLVDILYIEEDSGADLAFLRVAPGAVPGKGLASPIGLSARPARVNAPVAVIGYPARDSRIPDAALMDRTFGDVYDKKRLAPGRITGAAPGLLLHDCSTLGGNSGSVVLDLDTGEAAGLHFAGRFLEANYAVPAALVRERLEALGRAGRARAAHLAQSPPRMPGPRPSGDDTVSGEGRVEDYADRSGFDTGFLGADAAVTLPAVVRDAASVLTFTANGHTGGELKYANFSVVMNRERRLCFFSAVNIDGRLSKRTVRPGWRLDPRIPRSLQIARECYGNPPLFSRGHMTRREDPAWGTRAQANLGCADSMHVTNTAPQMQPFNAGLWRGLEDYALQHTREDEMRISVMTGPLFGSDDPVREGVMIPRAFWKVIAFVHEATGRLRASAYTLSQEHAMDGREFVFGAYGTHQRPLAFVERQAGLSFGALTACDVLAGESEESLARPLSGFDEIRL